MKPCRVNNLEKAAAERGLGDPLQPDAIVERARKFLEKNLTEDEWYRLLINNCEHFATKCRYGPDDYKGFSQQIPTYLKPFSYLLSLIIIFL